MNYPPQSSGVSRTELNCLPFMQTTVYSSHPWSRTNCRFTLHHQIADRFTKIPSVPEFSAQAFLHFRMFFEISLAGDLDMVMRTVGLILWNICTKKCTWVLVLPISKKWTSYRFSTFPAPHLSMFDQTALLKKTLHILEDKQNETTVLIHYAIYLCNRFRPYIQSLKINAPRRRELTPKRIRFFIL